MMMSKLADSISVAERFSRSINLERDIAIPEPLDGYIVTDKALDVLERFATTAAFGSAGGAWSITGPYGSGKSSLALLLADAYGKKSKSRQKSWQLIGEASSSVLHLIEQSLKRHKVAQNGFHCGVVTASREKLNTTVLRALHDAVLRSFGKIPPTSTFRMAKTLKKALNEAASEDPLKTGPSPADLIDIARCLAETSPLLLIFDEFGKTLEAVRDGGDADPYLLQQLAEAGQGLGLPIFVITLQHLSFDDYFAEASSPNLKEWAKVQGRFEDITFVESPSQTISLIGTVFEINDDRLLSRIHSWAEKQYLSVSSFGISDISSSDTVASCYPLHPLASAVLPELCNRYGQHERTLFSFLTGSEPTSASSIIKSFDIMMNSDIPTVGLDAVYDYFVASGALNGTVLSNSNRWIEIASRIRDTHGLSVEQEKILKSVAIINLVSSSGTIRASKQLLSLLSDEVDMILADLEKLGVLTYRDFADEYRVWQGTDIDIQNLLELEQQRIQDTPLADILSSIEQPQPLVAARHSAENSVLRVFSRRYANSSIQVEPLDAFSPYDGELLLVVEPSCEVPRMTSHDSTSKPAVAALPDDVSLLDSAAREVSTLITVLDNASVQDDWVARRELSERLSQARAVLEHALAITFGGDSCRWVYLNSGSGVELPRGRGTSPLSSAADMTFSSSPIVSSEMINRSHLTSQGAKARRVLLDAMINKGSEVRLGLDGYGPEVAIYNAFLKETGIHSWDTRNDTMTFRSPSDTSLKQAWVLLEDQFKKAKSGRVNLNDIYAVLLSPPIGMKAAVIPVFITAGLLAFSDEIALYEHGTFKPQLTSEISERMARNPQHFDIKHFANTTGARRQVIDALATRLDIKPRFRKHRVSNVLSAVGHLVSRISKLNNFTLNTNDLQSSTLNVKQSLVKAVEPDELLFKSLPTALGFRPIPATTDTYKNTKEFAQALEEAMSKLEDRYERLLRDEYNYLLKTCSEKTKQAIAGQAVSLNGEILNPNVRAFVLALAGDGLADELDWIQAIATIVSGKAPSEWNDDDQKQYRLELNEKIATFQRLVALHMDHRAYTKDGFTSLRITVTRSDGSDIMKFVGVENRHRGEIEETIDEVIKKFEKRLGSPEQVKSALAAILGDRMIPEQRTSIQDTDDNITELRASNG